MASEKAISEAIKAYDDFMESGSRPYRSIGDNDIRWAMRDALAAASAIDCDYNAGVEAAAMVLDAREAEWAKAQAEAKADSAYCGACAMEAKRGAEAIRKLKR